MSFRELGIRFSLRNKEHSIEKHQKPKGQSDLIFGFYEPVRKHASISDVAKRKLADFRLKLWRQPRIQSEIRNNIVGGQCALEIVVIETSNDFVDHRLYPRPIKLKYRLSTEKDSGRRIYRQTSRVLHNTI